MEFRIEKDVFLKGLQRVQGIVEKRNTMPILSNVLLNATGEKLEITATDLEVGMKSIYPATVAKEGKITVSAKKLFEIIRELPDSEITFSTRENDWVDIKCGKASFNIIALSPEEFPYFPVVNEDRFIRVEGEMLKKMVEKTSFAICHDETKYNLNGIFVKGQEENGVPVLKMAATDGHRLALMENSIKGAVQLCPELEKGVIFPKKGIYEIKKMAEEESGELLLGFMDNSAVIKRGDMTVVMRLVDGEFPDYNRVIPPSNDKKANIDRNLFLHSLKRMSTLSSDKSKGVKLEIQSNMMLISSSNPELGEAKEDMEIEYEGEAVAIGFNAKYIIDVLNVLDEDLVQIVFKDELSPAILTSVEPSGFLSVIMPMRL